MKKGFTLVELLVVIAIIALLSTLSVVALNSARAKARDARRLSDIKQIRTALEMYFDSNMAYPDPTASTTIGTGSYACLTSNGWKDNTCAGGGTIFMQKVPTDPQNPPRVYQYAKVDATHYRISYYSEGSSATKTATESTME